MLKNSFHLLCLWTPILCLVLFIFPGDSFAFKTYRLRNIGYESEFPPQIGLDCDIATLHRKPQITLRCEWHETEKAAYDYDMFSFLASDEKIIYLQEGVLVGKADAQTPHQKGLEDSYVYKLARLSQMMMDRRYYLSKQGKGQLTMKEVFDRHCETMKDYLGTDPVVPKIKYDKIDPASRRTRALYFLAESIMAMKCHSTKAIKDEDYIKYLGVLDSFLEKNAVFAAEWLERKNRSGKARGELFLPKRLVKLARDAALGRNWDQVDSTLIVNLRNVNFVKNIMQSYCQAAQEGKDIVVQVGQFHCDKMQELLNQFHPAIKVVQNKMGEAFGMFVKEFGGLSAEPSLDETVSAARGPCPPEGAPEGLSPLPTYRFVQGPSYEQFIANKKRELQSLKGQFKDGEEERICKALSAVKASTEMDKLCEMISVLKEELAQMEE